MKWRTRTLLPFSDGDLAAGVLLEEVNRNALSDTDRRYLDKVRTRERKQRKPRSIPIAWNGKLRFISAADLMIPRLLVIDTETTGLRKTSQVIEIAIVVVEGDQVTDAKSVLVRTPAEHLRGKDWGRAFAVHQITAEDILAAPEAGRVGGRLEVWYAQLGKPPCVAWPTSFDSRLCEQTWSSLKLFWPPDLCIKRLWSRVVGGRPPKLTVAAEQLGVALPEGRAHRALFDAQLAADVMIALYQRQARLPGLEPIALTPKAEAAEQRIQAAMAVG